MSAIRGTQSPGSRPKQQAAIKLYWLARASSLGARLLVPSAARASCTCRPLSALSNICLLAGRKLWSQRRRIQLVAPLLRWSDGQIGRRPETVVSRFAVYCDKSAARASGSLVGPKPTAGPIWSSQPQEASPAYYRSSWLAGWPLK